MVSISVSIDSFAVLLHLKRSGMHKISFILAILILGKKNKMLNKNVACSWNKHSNADLSVKLNDG